MSTNPSNPATMPTNHDETLRPAEFTVQTAEHADWVLKKIHAMDAELALVEAQARKMVKQIKSERERFAARFLPQVEAWALAELEASKGKKKSVALLHGTVQFTSTPARLTIENVADALQTARLVTPGAITTETVEKLDREALLSYAAEQFEATGEILPGLKRTEGGNRMSLRFPKPEGDDEGSNLRAEEGGEEPE